MPLVAPAQIIDAPSRVPNPYGLFSVITPVEDADFVWQQGFEWLDQPCSALPPVIIADCADPEGLPKDFANDLSAGVGSAFTVYGDFVCSPVGWTPQTANEQAAARLLTREEVAVTEALWTLLTTVAGPLEGTSIAGDDAGAALAALEVHLATQYGSQGVIIASPLALTMLNAVGPLVFASGNRLTTVTGTPVVLNRSEATAAIGIIPRPPIYRSEVFDSSNQVGDLLDRGVNNLYAVAERSYAAGWLPCGGAYTTITGVAGGGFGA